MVYDRDCDLIRTQEQEDCVYCYRCDICEKYYSQQVKENDRQRADQLD